METAKWALELVDKVSGPARRVVAGLGRAQAAASSTARALARFQRPASAAIGALGRSGRAAGRFGAELGARVLPSLLAVGSAATSAASAVTGFGAKFLVETLASKEQSALAFKTLLKIPGQAEAVQKSAIKMAGFFGASAKETQSAMVELLAAGFNAEDAMRIFQGALDVKGLAGADVTQISSVFAQISAAGKLTTQDLKQLGITGKVGVGNILREIGKLKGIDTTTTAGAEQISKLLEGGKISSAEAVTGSLKAIQTLTGGPLGSYAEKTKGTLGGLWETIKNAPATLVMSGDFSKLSAALSKFGTAFAAALSPDSATGKKLLALLGSIGDRVVAFLGSVDPGAIVDGISSLIDGVSTFVDLVAEFADAFGDGFMDVIRPLLTVIRLSDDGGGGAAYWADALRRLAKVLGWTVGILVLGLGTIAAGVVVIVDGVWRLVVGFVDAYKAAANATSAFFKWLVFDAIGGFFTWIGGMGKTVYAWGTSIVDGLWLGIKEAWAALLTKLKGLLDLLPAAAKKALGIASPSRVFMRIGAYTAEGFAQGVEAKNDNAQAALGALIAPPNTTRSSSSIGGASASLTVNVYGVKDADEAARIGRAAGDEAWSQLRAHLEGAALEVGAA